MKILQPYDDVLYYLASYGLYLMLTDHLPQITSSDDYIRAWFENSGRIKYPVVFVELGGQTSLTDIDTACIHYGKLGAPVTRIKRIKL